MGKGLQEACDSAQVKKPDDKDLSAEDLEKVSGGRPVKPIRPRADSDMASFEKTHIDQRLSPPRY